MAAMRDDRLFDEHIPRLRRYARALTGDRTQADDLVQDCLARAWEKLHLWRRGSDLRAWLFTIMHNLFANEVRRRKSRPELLALDDQALEVPQRSTAESGLALRDLEAALATLPAEQREVLLLVALEELRYEEVAKLLDIPIGTVMSRLARGRERLRALMSGASPLLRRVK
jgi:RNA polymerase sigma-70 factor (ECF subfamily)